MTLRWLEVDHDSLIDLSAFACCQPIDPPLDYQLEVEVYFQLLALPVEPPWVIILGYDDEGLAVACAYAFYEEGDSPPYHFIKAIGRDNRCHGDRYGDEAIAEVLRRMRAWNRHEDEERGVYTKIHIDNSPSRSMLQRNGFGKFHEDGHHQWWGREL